MLLHEISRVNEFIDQEFIKTLNNQGIWSVSDFIDEDPENIVKFSHNSPSEINLSLQSVLKFRKYLLANYPCQAAGTWYRDNRSILNELKSGISSFDHILDGGFKGGLVYEVYGLPGGGRTQLVLHLAAKNALQGYNSLYIDTKNDFCIDRFSEIISSTLDSSNPNKAKKIKLNCDQNDELLESYVNKVKIAKVFNIESLLEITSNIVDDLSTLTSNNNMLPDTWKFYRNIRLLLIDNIASIVLPLLGSERYPMSDITSLTSQLIDKLRYVNISTQLYYKNRGKRKRFYLLRITTINTLSGRSRRKGISSYLLLTTLLSAILLISKISKTAIKEKREIQQHLSLRSESFFRMRPTFDYESTI